MDNFTQFFQETTDWKANFIKQIDILKRLVTVPPYNYEWEATEKDIQSILDGTYPRSPGYIVFAKRLYRVRNNSMWSNIVFQPNQLVITFGLPLHEIYRAYRDNNYVEFDACRSLQELFYRCTNINNTPALFPMNDLGMKNLDETLARYKIQFDAINRMEEIHQTGQYERIFGVMRDMGFPKYKILKYEVKFGIPVNPDEIDDKTLIDML